MLSALIGHSGFVGGNLKATVNFDDHYSSSNITEMAGRRFDLVVCAGVSAAKWRANRNPETDSAEIAKLTNVLSTVSAEQFILISTVDVYARPQEVDEADEPQLSELQPYGKHRLELEHFVSGRFAKYLIIRLPALFGPGLRKNVLFDLLNNRLLNEINPRSRFQWYDVRLLWDDISHCFDLGAPIVNFATEPIATAVIMNRFFPEVPIPEASGAETAYDFRSRYADALGGGNGYMRSAESILQRMECFLSDVHLGVVKCGSPYPT